MKKKSVNIIIADDSPEFTEGIVFLISNSSDFNIIKTFPNGKELVEFPQLHLADIILIDIEMPIMNGMEVSKRIGYNHPSINTIALTMYMDKFYLEEIINAGFKAFVHKPEVAGNLFNVIEKVLNKNYVFPEKMKVINKNT